MKKKLALIIVFMLIFTSIQIIQPSLAKITLKNHLNALATITNIKNKNITEEPYKTDLIADQIYDVGNVTVWNINDTIFVKYMTTGEWLINETHLHIECELYDIPQENGNPIIAEFDYQSIHEIGVTEYTYKITRSYRCNVNRPLSIAAYAYVYKEEIIGGLDYIENNLPNITVVRAVHATNIPPYNQSYFKTQIIGDDFIEGIYNGWCVDLDSNMIDYKLFCARVYSSYETIPDGMLEKPENLDLVNYILNQHYIGKPSCCGVAYTFGDVQRAIWGLIEDQQSNTSYLGPWKQCRVNEILTNANTNGEGFVPGCGQIVAIILDPVNKQDGQISIIEFNITCETIKIYKPAWGAGLNFPGDEWATYFKFSRTIP